jgi:hypothetical protein
MIVSPLTVDTFTTHVAKRQAKDGYQLGYSMRSTEEVITPSNQSASIAIDPTSPNGYNIDAGRCINFEGFYARTSSSIVRLIYIVLELSHGQQQV